MKILTTVLTFLTIFVVLDLMILFASLAEVAEGQGGYWNPFWQAQAEFVLHPHL